MCVRFGWSSTLARPKSVTQTVPRVSSSRFDGLTSRCRTPWLVGVFQGLGHLHADAGHALPVRRPLLPGLSPCGHAGSIPDDDDSENVSESRPATGVCAGAAWQQSAPAA